MFNHFFFKMENAVTEIDRLSGIDENVCILHGNTKNMFLGINEKYETLSMYLVWKNKGNVCSFTLLAKLGFLQ